MPTPPRKPADTVFMRREMYEYATDGRLLQIYADACADGRQPVRPGLATAAADAAWLTKYEADRLHKADLFFVGDDIAELAEAAYPSMPDFVPRPEDLPARYGFVLLARPLIVIPAGIQQEIHPDRQARDVEIVAASWGPCPTPPATWTAGGWWVTWYSARDPDRPATATAPPLYVDNEFAMAWQPPGADEDRFRLPASDSTGGWARALLGLFRLARQANLAEQTTERTPRPERRRSARAGLPERDVRVTRLRRHLREQATAETEHRGREYRHRWIVRGHWRNAWLPSQQTHRPVWIAPYLKGPDGAPLIGGERVTVV